MRALFKAVEAAGRAAHGVAPARRGANRVCSLSPRLVTVPSFFVTSVSPTVRIRASRNMACWAFTQLASRLFGTTMAGFFA
ncbi:hypothetical protein, partial [Rhodovarius lipocyclicus]|uniref:hypothetical protein n=1 Tax=Rhodovarius lipocyclicus TaxID=268410 RepID=UPI001F2E6FEE